MKLVGDLPLPKGRGFLSKVKLLYLYVVDKEG